jgi:hypothetical protein
VLGRFLSDRCVLHKDAKATTKALTDAVADWAKANGEREVTRKALAARLSTEGCSEWRTKALRGWLGVRVLQASETTAVSDAGDGVTSGDKPGNLVSRSYSSSAGTSPAVSPPVTGAP